MAEYIERGAVLKEVEPEYRPFLAQRINAIPAADVRPVPPGGIGEMSDGYHTFDALYHQRLILFAALVKAYKQFAWKSYRHEDGELCFGGGWFIVGIDTPCGSYTYHYENKDFDLFDCKELPNAKHWDGHTDKDVTRLLSLPDVRPVVRGQWKRVDPRSTVVTFRCSECNYYAHMNATKYCPNCGADMRETCDGDSCPINFPDEPKYDPNEFFSAERSGK